MDGSVHDPTDPVGSLLFNALAMVAELESDLIRARTLEETQVAKAKDHLRGTQPKLSKAQQRHLREVHQAGTHSAAELAELAELFNVARSTVYRTAHRSVEHRRTHVPAPVTGPSNPATGKPELHIWRYAIGWPILPSAVSLGKGHRALVR
jgi:DNA invertase Pin-like site-specific DNA recombinase